MHIRALVIATLLGSAVAFAQAVPPSSPAVVSIPENPRYVFQSLDERFGVSTVTITALAQDGRGFLWMGTQQGLLRYDGSSIAKFTRADGLPTDVIDQLVVGPDGQIWVGTDDGIARYDGRAFHSIKVPVAGARIDSLYQIVAVDGARRALIATSGGLVRVDANDNSHYELWNRAKGLPEDAVQAVFCGDGKTVYFISGHRVGVLDEGDKLTFLPGEMKADTGTPIAVLSDSDGVVWVRTANHVFRHDASGADFVEDDAQIPKANDFGIPALDRAGHLMVPTVRGLFRRVGTGWQQIGERQGMETDATFAALEDREGAFWIGFGGLGGGRWPGSNSWLGWTKAEGLPDNVVWCELRDQQGRLWVGTDNGIALWDAAAHRWRSWFEKDGLAGDTVRQMALGKDGAIWAMSVPGGLTRIDPRTLKMQKIAKTPEMPDPAGIAIAANGDLWLGSYKYLKVLTALNPVAYRDVEVPAEAKGTTSHPVFAPDGTLWMSGRAGIARFDGKSWRTFKTTEGLRSNVVPEVLPLSGDEAWFRYVEPFGLGHLRITPQGVQVEHVTSKEGLHSDSVFLLGQDRTGRIWAGGNDGVSMIDAAKGIRNFTRADGLLWNDLSGGTPWADADGSIYFGTSRGLARYQPSAADFAAYHPDVLLTSVKLGGQERLGERDPVTPHDKRLFQVEFAELTFRDPESVRCRYRMAPVETEFVETAQHEARYSSLPSGDYEFQLTCRYADATWSQLATYRFRVARAWWESWWARGLEVLAALMLVLAVVWVRTRSLEADRQRLEAAVAARSAELAKANKELAEAALTDPLTGTHNRRFFDKTIDVLLQQVLREHGDPRIKEKRDLIFYLIDIDHFKQVNDAYGHHAGDDVLKQVVQRLTQAIRVSDLLVRWGGEEFLVVATGAHRAEAEVLAKRMLNLVGSTPLTLASGEKLPKTISVGWAAFPWSVKEIRGYALPAVLQMVDEALYDAKRSGRNQAVGAVEGGAMVRTKGPETT